MLQVDLAWQSVLVVVLGVVALLALRAGLRSASGAVTIIVIALFLAMALDPLVAALATRARLGRGWATVAVLTSLAALTVAFLSLAVPQLVAETGQLEQQLPATIRSLDDLPLVGDAIGRLDLSARLSEVTASLPDKVDHVDLGSWVGRLGFGLGGAILAFFLVAGALFEGPRMVADVRRAVPPARRGDADRIGRTVYRVLAKYFAGSIVVAIANGLWVSVSALAVGVPLSPVLGVWAALTSLIPQIGGLMGFAVVLVVSLTAGLGATIAMGLLFLVFMLLSNHVLVPTVVGRAVSLSAPVTMLAAIGGFSVAGVVGALFTVPTFGAIKAVVLLMRDGETAVEDRPKHDDDGGVLGRLRRRLHRRHAESPGPPERAAGAKPPLPSGEGS